MTAAGKAYNLSNRSCPRKKMAEFYLEKTPQIKHKQ